MAVLEQYRTIRLQDTDVPPEFGTADERVASILITIAEKVQEQLGVEPMENLEAYNISTSDGDIAISPTEAAEDCAREALLD